MKAKKQIKSNHRIKGLSKTVVASLRQFSEYHPPKRLSRNLRTMLIEFLMSDGATEALYLQDLLYDLEGLFALLDALEEDGERKASLLDTRPGTLS